MATNPAGQLYDQFAPPERLTLMLSALARGDEAEAERLRDSCPRKTYTQNDEAYEARLQLSFDTMMCVCVDLRCMWGKLVVLHWAAETAKELATANHITASLAFVDGARCARGQSQTAFFARARPPLDVPADGEHYVVRTGEHADVHVEEKSDAGDADEPEDEAEVDDDDIPPGELGEFGRRIMAVEGRAERSTELLLMTLGVAAKDTARTLVNVWSAFGRFCQSRLGVGPGVMLDAWQLPIAADFAAMLKRYGALKPEPAVVDEYYGYLCGTWDRKFGGRDDGGE